MSSLSSLLPCFSVKAFVTSPFLPSSLPSSLHPSPFLRLSPLTHSLSQQLTLLQAVGYGIATVGLVVYKFSPN
jgi:hypothetical protein